MTARRPRTPLLPPASLASMEAFDLAEDVRTRLTWRIAAASALSILAAAPPDLTTFDERTAGKVHAARRK